MDGDLPMITLVPAYWGLCGGGLLMFHWRVRIPPVVSARYRNSGVLRRTFFWWFQPGPRGLLRFLVLCSVCAGAFTLFSMMLPSLFPHLTLSRMSVMDWRDRWMATISYLFQIPFFLVFPLGLLVIMFKKLRDQIALQRTLVATFWGFAGAVTGFYSSWARHYRLAWEPVCDLVGVVVSPVSSLMVNTHSSIYWMAVPLRICLGALGYYLMLKMINVRQRQLEALEHAGE
jgi:hypothetical protein